MAGRESYVAQQTRLESTLTAEQIAKAKRLADDDPQVAELAYVYWASAKAQNAKMKAFIQSHPGLTEEKLAQFLAAQTT